MKLKVFQKRPARAGEGVTHQAALKPPRPFATPSATSRHAATAAQTDGAERLDARRGHDFGGGAARDREPRGGATGLPERLRAGMERLSGVALGDVRVHYNSPAPARHEAAAHTQGAHIHLAPGQERHLAHEAWHVVQQKRGRVRATARTEGGAAVNEDERLEHEADVMGAKASGVMRAGGQRSGHGPVSTNTANKTSHQPPAPALQFQKKRWTEAQRKQSQKFWEKKHAKEQRKLELARWRNSPAGRKARSQATLARLQAAAVPPRADARAGYKDVMRDVVGFLHPDHPVRSLPNAGGPQFVQQFNDPHVRQDVTRRVGIDVESSGHVQQLRPHLNLQTQYGGVVQKGVLKDPHTPVRSAEPFESSTGDQRPLHGLRLTAEERRKFIERYLTSSGIRVNR